MKYLEYVNALIKREIAEVDNLVIYGQNINAGSCLGGLTRGMKVKETSRIINTPNSENSLVGFGFGLMTNGAKGIFFMKQLDFLLLGVDHLVNTYNIIRSVKHHSSTGSFTIVAAIVDSGYEGPQASLNNFGDFCSIAGIPGFTITNKMDADYIIPHQLVRPGFRVIGLSQRLYKEEIITPDRCYINEDDTLFQYDDGDYATIVCFNFSFPYGWLVREKMLSAGKRVSLFNVNSPTSIEWVAIVRSLQQTGRLVVIDDSKSRNLSCFSLLAEISNMSGIKKKLVYIRKPDTILFTPNPDKFGIDIDQIAAELLE